MKNYITYKDDIQGFTEVSTAVKTVEKVAASSIARCRQEMTNLEAYQRSIAGILDRLSLLYHPERKVGKKSAQALIVITSDKGLTGGLWRRMIDEFFRRADGRYQTIIPLGAKGERYLREEKIGVQKSLSENPSTVHSIIGDFYKGLFSRIDILYPKFISLSEHRPVIIPFLPFAFESLSAESAGTKSVGLPIVDPAGSKAEIFERLMKKYVTAYFEKIISEGRLSEFSARTVSMEHAGNKTDELIKGLMLAYRKERRRALTQKQLESFIGHNVR